MSPSVKLSDGEEHVKIDQAEALAFLADYIALCERHGLQLVQSHCENKGLWITDTRAHAVSFCDRRSVVPLQTPEGWASVCTPETWEALPEWARRSLGPALGGGEMLPFSRAALYGSDARPPARGPFWCRVRRALWWWKLGRLFGVVPL